MKDRRRNVRWMCLLGALVAGCGGGAPAAEEPTTSTETGSPEGPSIVVTPEMGHPYPGEVAPDFELSDGDGNTVRLSSLRGQPVVLTFVASWCPYSEAAQPHLARLAEDYEGRPVHFLAIDLEEADEGYERYRERVPLPFPVLRDPLGESVGDYVPENAQPAITDRWKVLVSSYLLIDAEGVIRFYTLVDMANFDAELVHLRAALDALLTEGGA